MRAEKRACILLSPQKTPDCFFPENKAEPNPKGLRQDPPSHTPTDQLRRQLQANTADTDRRPVTALGQ